MNNTTLLKSSEFLYILYLIDELNKAKKEYYVFYNTREVKLNLLLDKELLEGHNSLLQEYDKLENIINSFDLYQLKGKNFDKLTENADQVLLYTKYLMEKTNNRDKLVSV